jgi:2-oxoglutarate ferredoxin oxidoreductase subunit delta
MTQSDTNKEREQKGYIEIDRERCKGCHLCVTACPKGLIETSDCLNASGNYPAVPKNTVECTACGMCWQVCPDVAITVYKNVKESEA